MSHQSLISGFLDFWIARLLEFQHDDGVAWAVFGKRLISTSRSAFLRSTPLCDAGVASDAPTEIDIIVAFLFGQT